MGSDYRIYTKPAELHKALNMLTGILSGLGSDRIITGAEFDELQHWCSLHANLANEHPFNELLPLIHAAMADGRIDPAEREDILWLCGNFTNHTEYYDDITSFLQILSGIIHGLLADNELNDAEINALNDWIAQNDFLKGCWPYDEIDALLTAVLSDGKIEQQEREQLMAFLGNVVEFKDSYNLRQADFEALRKKYNVAGICAVCPDISFDGKVFCLTGESYRATRAEIRALIEQRGGIAKNNVSSKTDYLIVCDGGNPCWAFACYGRKVEEAMAVRKSGGKVQLVSEIDFWDALID